MIPRIRKSIELPAGDRRIAGRMTLGFVAAVVCLTLVLAGSSVGLTASMAVSQPSPSGSPSGPAGEPGKIFLLNPNATYDPQLTLTEPPRQPKDPREPPDPDPPKISDEFDGVDEAYHVVAVVKDPPPTALIEAYYTPDGANEITAGQLSPVPGSDDTFELFWDISETAVPGGFGTFAVRLFQQTPSGFEEVSNDEVRVRMQHVNTPNTVTGGGQVIPAVPESETVEIQWPAQNGPLGFYKGAGAGATWQTVVDGTVSQGDPGTSPDPTVPAEGERLTYQVRVFYSVSPIGTPPEYTPCTTGISTGASRPDGTRPFRGTCTLADNDRPSQVTAVAAIAIQDQEPDDPSETASGNVRQPTQEGADAHRVQGFHQRVEDMKIELNTSSASDNGLRRHIVQGASSANCLGYRLTVTDSFDRPVQGANVDIHLVGPSDQVQFGTEASSAANTASSAKQRPQKGHATEAGRNCDANNNTADQGDHNVPGGNDLKHIESAPTGTGRSAGGGGVTFGQWQFHLWSPTVGDTEITAWIDDEPIVSDSDKREADDDLLEPTEAKDTNFAQWLPSAITITLDPLGATAAAGTCQRFIVRARAGVRPVRGANVDVHATGPTNDLDFCDPGDGSVLEAPTQGTGHNAEDTREVSHAGQPPVAQHTEGQTNDAGNLVIGISSPVPGDSTLTAWYDAGEAPFDNDELGTEANGSATTNWVESTGDAAISFLNPSPYGSAGTNVARTQDVDTAYHVVSRVSSITPVPGVEFFYRSGSNPLVKIADGTRVGETDTWEAFWPVDVADGTYTLVARIRDTAIVAEQSVTVRNQASMVDPTVVPFQTAEITAPLDGQRATFTNRRLTVRGVASAGAEGVHVYYTKAGSLSTPASGAWTQCATSTLPSATAPKEFALECALTGSDQPGLVTGIAAIAYNCIQNCTANQTNHSGDAHRIFGVESNPILSVEPAETAANTGVCQKFVVTLQDQTGQPIPGQNLDAHLAGPGGGGNFCSPEDGTGTQRRAPNEGGHISDGDETDEAYHDEGGNRIQHTETESTGNGRFVFGIESATAGDSQVTVWLDQDDDDTQNDGERSDISIMHWEDESVCDITGTDGPDELEGTDGAERICGFGGDDTIRGGGGEDVILGGAGNDVLRGNPGDDQVRGGAGRDRVLGGGGVDDLSGGSGPDLVKGHASDDRLRGNRGSDRLRGGSGRDDCQGGGGRDDLRSCETGTRSFAARIRPV